MAGEGVISLSRVDEIQKRVFDVIFSLILLFSLSPVLLVLSLIIKADSPGPVLYRGIRSGIHGKPFHILKFRTMVENAENLGGPSTAYNDPRLTRIGAFLRKYKLDELPQLINILKGKMSFVGPRPQVEKYTKLYNKEESIILTVRPGLTDYASIKFINLDQILGDENVDEKYLKIIEPEKNALRIKYVKERTFLLDIKILVHTFLRVSKIRSLWNKDR